MTVNKNVLSASLNKHFLNFLCIPCSRTLLTVVVLFFLFFVCGFFLPFNGAPWSYGGNIGVVVVTKADR